MPRAWVPERGDIVWQSGHRPAFVVSPREYNKKVGLALCCPVTSRVKGYPFEVVLPADGATQGAVLADQLKSLDWRARKAKPLERAPDAAIDEVTARILALVDP